MLYHFILHKIDCICIGLGESSIEPSIEPGTENRELPAVSYFTTGDQLSAKMSRNGKKKLKKKMDGQPLGVIEE